MKITKKIIALALAGVMALSVVPVASPAPVAKAATASTVNFTEQTAVNLIADKYVSLELETFASKAEKTVGSGNIKKIEASVGDSDAVSIASSVGYKATSGGANSVTIDTTYVLNSDSTYSGTTSQGSGSDHVANLDDYAKVVAGIGVAGTYQNYVDLTTWGSSTSIESPSATSKVYFKGVKAGSATLTINGLDVQGEVIATQTISISVSDQKKVIEGVGTTLNGASFDAVNKTLKIGTSNLASGATAAKTSTITFTAKTAGGNGDVDGWDASSADTKVASVSIGGSSYNDGALVVTPIGVGTTTITVGAKKGTVATGHSYILTVTVYVDTENIKATLGTDTKTEYDKAGNETANGTLKTAGLASAVSGDGSETTKVTPKNLITLDNVSTKTTKINASSAKGGTVKYTPYGATFVKATKIFTTSASLPAPVSVDKDGNVTVVDNVSLGTDGHAYGIIIVSSSTAAAPTGNGLIGADDLVFWVDISGKELTNLTVKDSAGNALKNGDTLTLSLKDKVTDTISVSSNAGDSYITSVVGDTTVATYSAGTISALKAGTTTVTFTANQSASTEGQATFVLNISVVNININNTITIEEPSNGVVTLSEAVPTYKIKASTAYKNVLTYALKTKNTDGTYAAYTGADLSVNSTSGEVTYKKTGNSGTAYVEITGTANADAGAPTPAYVQVVYGAKKATSDLAVSAVKVTVAVGASTATSIATSTQTLAYKVDDESIATVSAAGIVTGVKVGTTAVTITATENELFEAGEKTIAIEVVASTTSVKKSATIKASKTSLKASALKKKAQKVTIKVTGSKGKVTVKNATSKKLKKYVKISGKKVTIKKGAKKGTYKVKVTVAAKGNYKKTTKTISISVK